MELEKEPPVCALALKDTWYQFSNPELLKEWRAAERPRRGPQTKRSQTVKHNYQVAERRVYDDIIEKLADGHLIAWGRDGKPAAAWIKIPSDAWNNLNLNFNRNTAFIEKDAVDFHSVKILPVEYADLQWEGGLSLLGACNLVHSPTAEDLVEPWAPELKDGTIDENWTEGSREYAADQMWQIIGRQITEGFLSIYIRNSSSNEWLDILDFTNGFQLPHWEMVDFAISEIQMPGQEKPVACMITRKGEMPADKPTEGNATAGPSDIEISKANAEDVNQDNTGKIKNFSISKVTSAYLNRVEGWPDDTMNPSREEDEKWGAENYNAPRNFMRVLRNEYAPETWKTTGPRTGRRT